jgi:RNA polymerase-binding transcription factor DksA
MKKQCSIEETRRYERRLKRRLEELTQEMVEVTGDALGSSGDTRGPDEAAEASAVNMDLRVLAAADEERSAVDDALQRIAAGTFGQCAACGEAIERARLDLVPYASECAGCASATGRSA